VTQYTVFEKAAGAVTGEKGGGHWIECGEQQATSAKGAISAYLANQDQGYDGGTFAAVPSRSFQPVTVQEQTRIAFK
jgi:hypothetical protein